MRYIIAITACCILISCTKTVEVPVYVHDVESGCAQPFVFQPKSQVSSETRKILALAADDFCEVSQGRPPKHATEDQTADRPADGGSRFYVGNGYTITAAKSLSSFGDFHGRAEGPILSFDEEFAPGNMRVISSIRVYESPMAQ